MLAPQESSTADAASILAAHRKRSSARGEFPASSSEVDPSLKLKFLANLAGPSASPAAEEVYDPLLDPLADLELYSTGAELYEILARRSVAVQRGEKTYDAGVGTLVKEAARGDEGGFKVEEVWEKAVRASVAGLWDAPIGWANGGAMEVQAVA